MVAPERSEITVALGALLAGAGAGGAVVCFALFLVRAAQVTARAAPAGAPPGAAELAASVVAAFALAGGVAFWRARPFGERWQRVAVSLLAALGAAIPGLVAVPLDVAFGRGGVLALGAASASIALAGWAWASPCGGERAS